MSSQLILGDLHPCKYESLNTEFKEFCLDNVLDHSEFININNICKTGNLTNYEKQYIFKIIYISIFIYYSIQCFLARV